MGRLREYCPVLASGAHVATDQRFKSTYLEDGALCSFHSLFSGQVGWRQETSLRVRD